jgi:hypothetical protein
MSSTTINIRMRRPSLPSLSLAVRVVAIAAAVGVAGGCSTLSRWTSSILPDNTESAVPVRRPVNASATPSPTVAEGTSEGVASGAMSRQPTSAPLTMPGNTPGSAAGRSLLAGSNGGLQRVNDNGLSEGGANLSQVSFATEGGDYAPDVDRTGTFMVFASTQHRPTFDIYRKSVDGRTVTQLTTDPSDDLMPAISSDGTKIAFASNRNGNWDIFTMPITGGAPVQITFDADEEVQPTWAPDGKRLAFSRKNGRTGTWEIWIVDSTTPGLRTFVCEGFLPRWSPTDEKDSILFQRARQRGSRLYGVWTVDLVRGEGINPTEIVSAKNAAILQPNWSPDGQKIVFTTVVNPDGDSQWPEQSDIWVVNADGTGRVGLTNSRFRNMQPAWGADGRVYFVSNRGGVENIWSITADATRHDANAQAFVAEVARKAAMRNAAGTEMAGAAPKSGATGGSKGPGQGAGAGAPSGVSPPEFLRREQLAGAGGSDDSHE